MLSIEDIKQYLLENRKQSVLLIVGLVCLLIAVSVAFAQRNTLFQSSQKQDAQQAEEFVVFDYNKLKNEFIEQKEKQKLEELAVKEDDIQEEGMENLMSQLPVEDNKVTVNVQTAGRSNPFAPYTERSLLAGGKFDIVEPPEYIPEAPEADDLMKTTVSGILFNSQKSSAIINVNGTDELVNKGDMIAGFKIVNITRNKVYVKKGYNIIAAGVGEAIETPALTYNSVYNLPQKFGGKYSAHKKGVILINGEQQ